jgi:integrase
MARTAGTGHLLTRVDSAGRESWYGKWRVDGRQVFRKLGPKKTKAQPHGMTARQAEVALREKLTSLTARELERLALEKAQTGRTIAEVLDAYLADHDGIKQHTTAHDYRRVGANWFGPFFEGKTVDEITPEHVRELRDLMRVKRLRNHGQDDDKGLAPKSIRNHLTLLSTLLTYAVDRGWATTNAAAKVPRPGDQDDVGGDLQFLEPHEVTDLVAHVQPGDYEQIDAAMYLTAAHTGLRLSELRALRWHAVDMARGVVRVERGWTRGEESSPKSRKRRSVPLSPAVAAALAELQDASDWSGEDDRVFAHPHTGEPLPGTPLSERFAKARDAAGVPAITFHGLRHTFGTTLARAGWPVGDIQALMGHADIATTQIYMHYAPRHDQAERIAAAFAGGDPRLPGGSQATDAPPAKVTQHDPADPTAP